MSMYDDFEPSPEHGGMFAGSNKDYWVTRQGIKIKFSEMSDTHLKNTVNMINKRGNNVPAKMKNELNKRGIQ